MTIDLLIIFMILTVFCKTLLQIDIKKITAHQ